MFQIGMCGVPPHLILKHRITLVVSLAQLVSPSVALLAELVLRHAYTMYQGVSTTTYLTIYLNT